MDKDNTIKKNMLFNTTGSAVYFACQWLLLIVVVHITDYSEAGLLSLATNVTASPYIIALYGMRNYQVSDIEGKFSDRVYFLSRILSSIIAMSVCLIMIVIGRYDLRKSLVILAYMIFKIIEAFSDYYYGLEQKINRMDYSGVSLAIRGIATLAAFIVSYWFMKNLLVSLALMICFSLGVIIFYDIRILRKYYDEDVSKGKRGEVSVLMKECFPLAFVSYLNNLSIVLPRIMLEHYHGEEIMGYYSSVASPTSVIQLLATNLFAPLILVLTIHYNEKNVKKFTGILKRFFAGALIVSIVCVAAAEIMGEWVLVQLFKPQIRPYVYLFVPVIIMTVFMALNSCLFGICTLMRAMKEQYIRGAVGVVSSFAASLFLVKRYGAMGVVYASMIAIMFQMLLQLSVIVRKLKAIKDC